MRQTARNMTALRGMAISLCIIAIIGAKSTVYAAAAGNTDIERFLPNHGNSVFNAANLARKWPAEGPKKLWQVEIGWGKTAVVEAKGRAFTATETENKQWALCLDPLTGTTLWKRLLHPKENRHFVKGPVTSTFNA